MWPGLGLTLLQEKCVSPLFGLWGKSRAKERAYSSMPCAGALSHCCFGWLPLRLLLPFLVLLSPLLCCEPTGVPLPSVGLPGLKELLRPNFGRARLWGPSLGR